MKYLLASLILTIPAHAMAMEKDLEKSLEAVRKLLEVAALTLTPVPELDRPLEKNEKFIRAPQGQKSSKSNYFIGGLRVVAERKKYANETALYILAGILERNLLVRTMVDANSSIKEDIIDIDNYIPHNMKYLKEVLKKNWENFEIAKEGEYPVSNSDDEKESCKDESDETTQPQVNIFE